MKPAVFLAVLCLLAAGAFAGESYLDLDAVDRTLDSVTVEGRVHTLGKSVEGRPIRSVLVGLPGPTPLDARPRLLIVAGLQADHRVGTAVARSLIRLLGADTLAEAPEDHPLRRLAVEILPLANPDGLVALLSGPERILRTNLKPVDIDRDGLDGEDGPEDLDGDGRITLIRVPKPGGSHGPSPDDPRILVPAGPEVGVSRAYDLYSEGRDADEDGQIAEDGPGGVDLDRNFPHGWDRNDLETGRSCPSEPESRALADHLLNSPRVACVLVFGRNENLVAVPPVNAAEPRREPTGPLPEDLVWFRRASEQYLEATGAAGKASDAPDGAFHQWVYAQRGIPAFSTRVFHGPPGTDEKRSPELRWLAWFDEMDVDHGFVPWRPFDHPTLGKVEIGGFAPLSRLNPPAGMLPDLAITHADFVVRLLKLLPAPTLDSIGAKAIARGVYEVRATVRNDGRFPLITAMGRMNRAPHPVRVDIDLPADAVLTRNRLVSIDRLDGFGGSREIVWIVRADPGTRIRVRAVFPAFGTVEGEVEL